MASCTKLKEMTDSQGPVHAMTLHLHKPEGEHLPALCTLLVFLVSL